MYFIFYMVLFYLCSSLTQTGEGGVYLFHTASRSRILVGLVATKSHACYLLGGTGWDWVRIPLTLNFSGSAGGVSGHTYALTGLPGD